MTRTTSLKIALTLAGALFVAGNAHGQPREAERAASAEALFREAKRLMDDGNYVLACPKLEASQRLDPAVGTLLNLAVCHEQLNRTASAWAQYLRAAAMARRKGQVQREKYARERATALEPKLTRLAFAVAEEALVEGLEVRRDGILQESAMWATSTPVDPGTHVVSATAPGKKEWRTTIDVSGEGKIFTVDVPPLEDAPEQQPTPAPAQVSPQPSAPPPQQQPVAVTTGTQGDGQRTLGIIVGGVGLAGMAVGTVFGLQANSKWNDTNCPNNVCPTSEQQDRAEDAKRFADISTWSFAAGGALVVAGTVLWATASDEPVTREVARDRTSVGVVPAAGKDTAGLLVHGRF
ncbi:MAG: hypothetical protein ACOC1F_09520 [Myxococcota bacterium]